jgi:hypothetical protein
MNRIWFLAIALILMQFSSGSVLAQDLSTRLAALGRVGPSAEPLLSRKPAREQQAQWYQCGRTQCMGGQPCCYHSASGQNYCCHSGSRCANDGSRRCM